MKSRKTPFSKLPANAVILGAKGYHRNGKSFSIVKYTVNGSLFTVWISEGGAA